MADRDFAQLQAAARPPDPGMSGLSMGMLVLAIVAVVIVGFVGGYQLGSRQGHEKAESEARAKLVAQIKAQKQELAALRKQHDEDKARAKAEVGAALPGSDVGDLTFYTDLPKQPVKPEPLSQPVDKPAMPSAPAPKPVPPKAAGPAGPQAGKPAAPQVPAAAPAEGYYVQVASFRDAQAAAKIRARLAAIGLDSGLRRVRIAGRGIWYRLQVGPYGSPHDADAVRADIQQKMRIKGIVVHEGG